MDKKVHVIAPMRCGTFVRVRRNHRSFWRAGKDGMVIEDYGNSVALVFYGNRYGHGQGCICVGPELWHKSELDMETVEV